MARGSMRPSASVLAVASELLDVYAEDNYFAADLDIAARDCMKLFRDFNSITPVHRQAALIHVSFHLGGPMLGQFINLRAAVDLRDWRTAAEELRKSSWVVYANESSDRITDTLEHGKIP